MFAGLCALVGLILRRERIKLPIWILAIGLSLLSMVPLLQDVYGDPEAVMGIYQTFSANPAAMFMTGPMDASTFGALMTIETVLWWGLAIAFMNTLLVIRHTRHNEETGAQELILSGRVHRSAGLVSVLIVALLANVVLTLIIGAGLVLMNPAFGGGDVWLYAAAFGGFGMAWAAIAAVAAQLFEGARSANGALAGLIGLGFLLRGIGDVMGNTNAQGLLDAAWPSMLSPFGWLQATRSLTVPDWSPLVIPLLFAAVATAVAFWLLGKRDVGAGMLAARGGHARASKFLRTPLGLTWHLQKNVFIGWAVGVLIMAGTVGALVPSMSDVYDSSDMMRQIMTAMGGQGAIIETFLAAMLAILVIMVIAYAVHGLGRVRSEESGGQLEQLLATRLSRLKWLGLHGVVVGMGGVALLVIAAVAMAGTVNIASDLSVSLGEYIVAALSYAPAVLLFIGLYIALFGMLPRLAGLVSWLYFGFVMFVLWIAPMLNVGGWVMNLSPLAHFASAPSEAIVYSPLVIVFGLGLLLIGVGASRFARRDIASN